MNLTLGFLDHKLKTFIDSTALESIGMPKNVILLTIDTLRKDALGCYGGGSGVTPFIDSIQGQSIRFLRAHSTGPYTQASFPSILTSSYYLEYMPEERLQERLSSKRVFVSEVLQYRGIATAAFHSNAYLWDCFGWNMGWDVFFESSDEEVEDKVPYTKASILNSRVRDWLLSQKNRATNAPFFLWLHYMDVHEPYIPDRKYLEVVDSSLKMTSDEMFGLFANVLLKRDVSDKNTIEL